MADPDPNPNNFDATPFSRALTTFFGMLGRQDRQVLFTFWEQLTRALDDTHHELRQINEAKNFLTVGPYLQRDWLKRDLTNAEFIGTPHGHFDSEFTAAGGELTFAIGRPLDPGLQTKVFINGVETAAGSGWVWDLTNPLNPLLTLSAPALAGQVYRVYAADVLAIAITVANGIQTVFAFSQSIDPTGVQIYHDNVELTRGIVIRSNEVLFMGGLTGGQVVQFRKGAELFNVVAAAGQVRVRCPFTLDAATIIRLNGINIRDGWVVTDTGVSFKTAPRTGVTIRIQAPRVDPHEHRVHQETSTLGQTVVDVPADTPFALGPAFAYDADYPVLVFLNGILLDQSFYTFTGAAQLTLAVPLPADIQVLVYWHDRTDFSHAHPPYEQVLTEDLPAGTGVDLVFLDADKPALVLVNGVALPEGLGLNAWQYVGGVIRFGQTLLAGTRITLVAEKFQWRYRWTPELGFDSEIRWMDSIQDGIDLPVTVLLPQQDFLIFEQTLYLNQLVEPAWFKNVLLDIQTPYNNFGYLLDFQQATSAEYLDLLRALWAAQLGGDQIGTLREFGRIMLGAPPAQYPGVVTAVAPASVSGYAQAWTVDVLGDDGVTRRFTLLDMPPAVSVGQRVERFTALGAALTVVDAVSDPAWNRALPLWIYGIERFGNLFNVAALWDKGLRSTYRVSAIADYDAVDHSIVVTLTALDFRLLEDLNGQFCRVTLFQGAARFDSRIDPVAVFRVPAVENLGWGYRVRLDRAYTFAVPPAPIGIGGPIFVEFEFERQRRFDLDFILDEYIEEHIAPIDAQLFALFRFNLFVLQLTLPRGPSPERAQRLIQLAERIRAVETQYLILGEMRAEQDAVPLGVTETAPDTPANFFQTTVAFLVNDLTAFDLAYHAT